MPRTFTLTLLACGLALGAARGQARVVPEGRRPSTKAPRTVVRVLGPEGEVIPGTKVYVCRGPFVGEDRTALNRVTSFACNERGIAKLHVAGGAPLCCWAVAESPTLRLASPVFTNFVPGRPIRLVLKKFEAFRVRCLNIEDWLRVAPGAKLRFVMHGGVLSSPSSLTSNEHARHLHRENLIEGFVAPQWEIKAPSSRDAAIDLPPLPWHSYYAVLCDKRGGFLDTRYMNPNFHPRQANARVQHLYERDKALKQLAFGKPTRVEIKIQGIERGLVKAIPLPYAQVLVRPDRQQLQAEFETRANAFGDLELLLPARPSSAFGHYKSRLVAYARGYSPKQVVLVNPPKPGANKQAVMRDPRITSPQPILSSGRVLDWRIQGLERDDRLLLFTMVESRQRDVPWSLPIRVDRDGKLAMPSPTRGVERGQGRFDLILVRGSDAIPLWASRHAQKIPSELRLDVRQLCEVDLSVHGLHGRAKGGVLEIHSSTKKSHVVLRRHLDRRGRDRFWLPEGSWCFTMRTPRSGDALRTIAIVQRKQRVRIELLPYRLVQGSCTDANGKTAPTSIHVQSQWTRVVDPVLLRLASLSNIRFVTQDDGVFAAYVSAQPGSEFRLSASARFGRRSHAAVALLRSRKLKAMQLVLGRSSKPTIW